MHIILKLKVLIFSSIIAANISLLLVEAADFDEFHLDDDSLRNLKTDGSIQLSDLAITRGAQNSDGTCRNNRDWKQSTGNEYNCGDIQFVVEDRRVELCQIEEVHLNCPVACGICCEDDSDYTFPRNNGIEENCEWLAESGQRQKFFCNSFRNGQMVRAGCPKTCNYCNDYVSLAPSAQPSMLPTTPPTRSPSMLPTKKPSSIPSRSPTSSPSMKPSPRPSYPPSNKPSRSPIVRASNNPSESSNIPTVTKSSEPSSSPEDSPSSSPLVAASKSPSVKKSVEPSSSPEDLPSASPSSSQLESPSAKKSVEPSSSPEDSPSKSPSAKKSVEPSSSPEDLPSASPSSSPSESPSVKKSAEPSSSPEDLSSASPSSSPSESPSLQKSAEPSSSPEDLPSSSPSESANPSSTPTDKPSSIPSNSPTASPSSTPTDKPSASPSTTPTSRPSSSPSEQPTFKNPNLIMIITDEHNLRTLSCYRDYLLSKYGNKNLVDVWGNNRFLNTPNIDSLASDGALFTNFYAASPLCTPARASFMTGLYPPFTGAADQNNGELDNNIKTFANILRDERGYATSYMGKWHLDGQAKPGWGGPNGRDFGFDDNKYRYNRGHWKYFEEFDDRVQEYVLSAEDNFVGKQNEHFATDFLMDRGLEFVDKAVKDDRPFALVLSIPDPHSPNENRPYYRQLYQDLDFKVPDTGRRNLKFDPAPPGFNFLNKEENPPDEADAFIADYEETFFVDHMQQYFGMVKCIDFNIGKMLKKLKGLGIEDDTVIVFTSDHGDLLGEHGKLNKNQPYETSAGIPFIVKYPDLVPRGKIIETPYTSVDFAPTILSLMGISQIPSGVNFQGIDGSEELTSSELLTNNDSQIRFSYETGNSPVWAMAIKNGYKFVIQKGGVPWLFDLNRDAEEMINYADSVWHTDIYNELREALISVLKDYKVPLTEIADYIFLDMPSCVDSRDALPLTNGKTKFCTDIGDSVPITRCENQQKIRDRCPISCNACTCEDSPGKMWVDSAARTCDSLKSHCNTAGKVRLFCPKTCGVC